MLTNGPNTRIIEEVTYNNIGHLSNPIKICAKRLHLEDAWNKFVGLLFDVSLSYTLTLGGWKLDFG